MSVIESSISRPMVPSFDSNRPCWNRLDLPQRLHKVCVLLWRLPNELVPFAVKLSVFGWKVSAGRELRTHFDEELKDRLVSKIPYRKSNRLDPGGA